MGCFRRSQRTTALVRDDLGQLWWRLREGRSGGLKRQAFSRRPGWACTGLWSPSLGQEGTAWAIHGNRGLYFFVLVELRFDSRLDFLVKRLVVLQNFFRGVPALGKLSAFIIQPGTAFFDDLFFQREIEQGAGR